jgi:carotenoid cleavage dioxygenase-like enzyme
LKTSLLPSKATDSTSAHVKRQPKAGHTLSAVDVNEISNRLVERDGLLRMYQKLLIEKEQRLHDFVNTH